MHESASFAIQNFKNFSVLASTPSLVGGRGRSPAEPTPWTISGASRLWSSSGRFEANCLDSSSPHQQFLDPPLVMKLGGITKMILSYMKTFKIERMRREIDEDSSFCVCVTDSAMCAIVCVFILHIIFSLFKCFSIVFYFPFRFTVHVHLLMKSGL